MSRNSSIVRAAVAVFAMGAIAVSSATAQPGKAKDPQGKAKDPQGKAAPAKGAPAKVVVKAPTKPKTVVATSPRKPTVVVTQPKRTVVTSGGDVPPGQLKKQLGLKSASSVAPGHVKKRVTVTDALGVTRTVLLSNGYEVVRVMPYNGTQIVYYRVQPTAPLERIVIAPAGEQVAFRYAPQSLLAAILSRLGM